MTSIETDAGDKLSFDIEEGKIHVNIRDADGGEAVAYLSRRDAQLVNYMLQTMQYELTPVRAAGPDGMTW